jgi:hypothetical protein
MQPHQQRVVEEQNDLEDKLAKLRKFHVSTTFDGLAPAEQARLHAQAIFMSAYNDILKVRIEAFGA